MVKPIYSLNLIAYILYQTGIKPQMFSREDGVKYAIFPEDKRVAHAITHWRSESVYVDIKRFLAAYGEIRNLLKNGGIDNEKHKLFES